MDEPITTPTLETTPAGVARRPIAMPSVRRRSREPQHRRRRGIALALAGLALVIVIAVLASASGGGTAPRVAHVQRGYFGRLGVLAGSGAGSLAAGEAAAENAAIDRTLAYTPLVRVAGSQHREIALTFDDGPGPFTPEILAVLEHAHVPATFFSVGSEERYFHDATAREVADGFPIGDHTEEHAPMSKLSARDQRQQLLQQISDTGDYGAPFPRLFRPPYGLFNTTTLKLLHKVKMLMVMWTIDTEDYRRPGADAIVNTVMSNAKPGAIVLMHDAGGSRSDTVAALPRVISALQAQGYTLVTVPRLLLDNPAPADQSLPAGTAGGGG